MVRTTEGFVERNMIVLDAPAGRSDGVFPATTAPVSASTSTGNSPHALFTLSLLTSTVWPVETVLAVPLLVVAGGEGRLEEAAMGL
eukprot:2295148-Amphidinium_carterae.1